MSDVWSFTAPTLKSCTENPIDQGGDEISGKRPRLTIIYGAKTIEEIWVSWGFAFPPRKGRDPESFQGWRQGKVASKVRALRPQ